VESGEFREDLFYRLDVVRVELPPLRARQADIPLLVNHFLQRRGARLGKVLKSVDAEVLARFAAHPWPGNIRELENTIDRAIVLAKGDTVTPDLLPTLLREAPRAAHPDARYLLPLTEAKTQFESEYVERVMSRAMGKQAEAAKLAGVDRSNFRRLLKRLNLDPGEPKSG
jgi:two-component system, NtrC family, response regulator HydG